MFRISSLVVTAALFSAVLTGVIQAQGREGGQGRQGGRGQQAALPDGPGKEAVTATCSGCHGVNLITGSTGYTHARWQDLISTMVKLPEAQTATITQYLATHFPPKPGREPVLVPGPVSVTFKEWITPTLGQRSRDPLQMTDGTIFWAGQYGSLVGRLNPRTGEMKEWKLDRAARPHSIINDRFGNIWYTGNGNGTMGKLNPATGEITVFKMPDPNARDPHTPIFDRNGLLWFTVQGGNFIGRLDPKTGAVSLKEAPAGSRPYGIVVTSSGTPVFDLSGTNKIGAIDPATMEITEYVVTEGARPRRIAVDRNDIVWYTDYPRGYLGRVDLKTKQVQEFASPGGRSSMPYGMTTTADGAVWYSESGMRPNTLVRFDPASKTFQTWNIPNGGGVVRHMVTAPNGDLLLAYSGVNKVGRVRIKKTT